MISMIFSYFWRIIVKTGDTVITCFRLVRMTLLYNKYHRVKVNKSLY